MNPYLEHPSLWPGVHHWLITELARCLTPQIRPRYYIAIEERVYELAGDDTVLVGIPDNAVIGSVSASRQSPPRGTEAPSSQPIVVTLPMPETVREGYLEVRQVGSHAVITTLEVLSPKNKRSGNGRDQYEAKRLAIMGSRTHLVEIDLLRAGEPMPVFEQGIQSHYRILISRSDRRPKAELYAFNVQSSIPTFALPLQAEDPEPLVDLNTLFGVIYDQGGYDLRLDYCQDPVPGFQDADALWLEEWLRQAGLRSH
jgi:hypothetical protein